MDYMRGLTDAQVFNRCYSHYYHQRSRCHDSHPFGPPFHVSLPVSTIFLVFILRSFHLQLRPVRHSTFAPPGLGDSQTAGHQAACPQSCRSSHRSRLSSSLRNLPTCSYCVYNWAIEHGDLIRLGGRLL